ncbi:sigma factor-like helix-turn-helix DNA-binding protein [Bacillus sp. S13(2024)]
MIQNEELEEILGVLTVKEREVIELHLKELTSTEISEILGKSGSAVTSLISKAKRSIKQYYTYDYAM